MESGELIFGGLTDISFMTSFQRSVMIIKVE